MHPLLLAGLIRGQNLRLQTSSIPGIITAAQLRIDEMLSSLSIRGMSTLDPERSMDWTVIPPRKNNDSCWTGYLRFTPFLKEGQFQLVFNGCQEEPVRIRQEFYTPSATRSVGAESGIPVDQIEDLFFMLGQSMMQILSEDALRKFNPTDTNNKLFGFGPDHKEGFTIWNEERQDVVRWGPEDSPLPGWLKENLDSDDLGLIIMEHLKKDDILPADAVLLRPEDFEFALARKHELLKF